MFHSTSGLGLNEDQYLSLCRECDRVLMATDSSIQRVAIQWLHVIREHPVFLSNYADLFEFPNKRIKAWCHSLASFSRNCAGWLRQIIRALRADGQPWHGQKELPEKIDLLIISHLLSPSQAGQSDDFYFGGLPNDLVAQGRSVVIALINHSGQPGKILVDKWEKAAVTRVVFSDSLCLSEEISILRGFNKESLRLRKLARKESPGLFRNILLRASRESLSGGSRTTLRLGKQIGLLVSKLNPKTIMITHEGHSWERIAFASSRRENPEIRCIGYQHAALFRLQHAIRRNLSREYNPDLILTAGNISKEQLIRSSRLTGIPIDVLGSNRSYKRVTINGDCSAEKSQTKYPVNASCLVLPEGIMSECNLLFEFSLACAQLFPEIRFIWRLHPILANEFRACKNSRLKKLPSNIVISQATFDDDIANCRWVLYRGTTAVVQTVVAGLRPIYLGLRGEMTIDPLYELRDWRVNAATVSDFSDVINADFDINSSSSELQAAIKYCEDFFVPLDAKILFASIAK
jgi:hypothetical protein